MDRISPDINGTRSQKNPAILIIRKPIIFKETVLTIQSRSKMKSISMQQIPVAEAELVTIALNTLIRCFLGAPASG